MAQVGQRSNWMTWGRRGSGGFLGEAWIRVKLDANLAERQAI